MELSPKFETNIYEYTTKYNGDKTSLKVDTTTTDPNYVVDIKGNEDIKIGENLITILVSDSDGNTIATYQIKLEKCEIDQTLLNVENDINEKTKKQIIIVGSAVVVLLVIILFIVIKKMRNQRIQEEYRYSYDDDYEDEEYIEENPEQYYEDEDNYYNYEEEVLSKQKARKMYLDNYKNSEDEYEGYDEEYEDYEEDDFNNGRHRAKRFK